VQGHVPLLTLLVAPLRPIHICCAAGAALVEPERARRCCQIPRKANVNLYSEFNCIVI
jgi:hypothetical protein